MTRFKDKETALRHEEDRIKIVPLINEHFRLILRYIEETSRNNDVGKELKDRIYSFLGKCGDVLTKKKDEGGLYSNRTRIDVERMIDYWEPRGFDVEDLR